MWWLSGKKLSADSSSQPLNAVLPQLVHWGTMALSCRAAVSTCEHCSGGMALAEGRCCCGRCTQLRELAMNAHLSQGSQHTIQLHTPSGPAVHLPAQHAAIATGCGVTPYLQGVVLNQDG